MSTLFSIELVLKNGRSYRETLQPGPCQLCCCQIDDGRNRRNVGTSESATADPMLGWEVVDEILEGEGEFLISDGLDEFPSTILKEDNSLIWQLISGSCLPKATVVVTSRPPTRMSFKSCQTRESKYIELVGFTEEDRVKYASIFSSQHNCEDNEVHPITLFIYWVCTCNAMFRL